MKKLMLVILVLFGMTSAWAQEDVVQDEKQNSACPISKKEAYVLHIEHSEHHCQLTQRQNRYILKVRKAGNIDEIYEYTKRLNSEVGIFEDEN